MNKKITFGLFACFLFLLGHDIFAVPAVPWPVEKTQPDGSKITVYIRGDEKIHWMESIDGYTLMYNTEKYIVYAERDAGRNMIPSNRKLTETSTPPGGIMKGLSYSQEQIRAMQQLWEVTGNIPPQRVGATTGSRKALCVLMGFKDKPFAKSKGELETLFNQLGLYPADNSSKGSVRDFFRENSYGQLDLTVTLAGPYTADNNLSYYAPETRWQTFALEAAQKAYNAGINFNDFADNGVLETFHILFAGYGDENINNGQQIWSHKWGFPTVNLGGVSLSVYSCSPELRGSSGNNTTYIGVICHELTHVFGSPDYYDTDYSGSGGNFAGSGNWDLMANGSWNDNGRQPAHINMFQKILYNWVTPVELTSQTVVTGMPPSAQTATSFTETPVPYPPGPPVAYSIQANSNGEMYVLENRQRIGFDSSTPGTGLLIWHVHQGALTGNANNAGHPQQMYPVAASSTFQIPTGTVASYGSVNSSGTPFPGSSGKQAFSANTTPAMFTWTGLQTVAKPITEITEAANRTVSFKFMDGPSDPVVNLQSSENAGNVTLTWNTPANGEAKGYKIYRNGLLQYTINNKTTTTYTQISVTNDTYVYGVSAFYETTESAQATKNVTVTTGPETYHLPVANLKGISSFDRIHLSWERPFNEGWMSIAGTGLGAYTFGEEFMFFAGTLWGPDQLKGMNDYEVTQLQFYLNETTPGVAYRVQIWEVNNVGTPVLVCDQAYTQTPNFVEGIKTVSLNSPVKINASKEYIVGVEIHTMGGYCLYVGDNPMDPGRNWIYKNGGWFPMETTGVAYNFYTSIYLCSGNPSASSPNIVLESRTKNATTIENTGTFGGSVLTWSGKSSSLNAGNLTLIDGGPELAAPELTKYIIYRNGVEIDQTTGPSFEDSGLTYGTNYSYCVLALYSDNNASEGFYLDIATDNPYKPVQNLKANIVGEGVILTWNKSDNVAPDRYKVLRDGTELAETTGTTYTDNSTVMQTTYNYCVIAVYDGIDVPGAPLYTTSFETTERDGISIINANGDSHTWGYYLGASFVHSGSYCAIDYSWNNSPITPNDWLVLPAVALPAGLSSLEYYVAAYSSGNPLEHYDVYISTSYAPGSTDVSSFTSLYGETLSSTTAAWTKHTIDLSAYAGNTVALAFRHWNSYDQWAIMLDDVSVYPLTHIPGTAYSDPVCLNVVTFDPYQPVETFDAKVVASDVSLTWTMPSVYANSIVFEEGFENIGRTFAGSEWKLVDADGDGYPWYVYGTDDDPTLNPHGGARFATSFSWYVNPLKPDNWLISPSISLTNKNMLEYYVCALDASYPSEHYGVYISTTNTNLGSFTLLTEETLTASQGYKVSGDVKEGVSRINDKPEYVQGGWCRRTIDLSAYAGQTVYIAFRHFDCTNMYWLSLDDVTVFVAGEVPPHTFNVYADDALIASNLPETTLSYNLTGVTPGEHTYCVKVVYESGAIESPATCKTVTVFELGDPHLPVVNLRGSTNEYEGTLYWDEPKHAQTLKYNTYESGSYNTIGTNSAADFDIAMRFTPEDLKSAKGLLLTKVSFIPVLSKTTTAYSIRVWLGGDWNSRNAGTMVVDQIIPSHNANLWNEITLDTPVPIDGTQELWIGVRCNTTSGRPASMEKFGAIDNEKGNLMFYQGGWHTATDLGGFSGNWIINAFATYHQGLDAIPARRLPVLKDEENRICTGQLGIGGENAILSPQQAPPVILTVEKYEISRDGVLLDETTELTYTDMVNASGTYNYAVTAVYEDGVSSEPVSIDLTYLSECDNAPANVTAIRTDNVVSIDWNFTPVEITVFSENFENGIPTSWGNIDVNGDGNKWFPNLGDGLNGGNCVISESYISGFGAVRPNNWLISPAISISNGNRLNYYITPADASYPAEHYGVFISTTGTTIASFGTTPLFQETLQAPAAWQKRTIDLSAYSGQTVYIAFRHYNSTDQFQILLDNISITKENEPVFNVYENGVLIGEQVTGNHFEWPITDGGLKTYCVSYVGENCESEKTCAPSIEIKLMNFVWEGAIDSDWDKTGNWSPQQIPATNTDIVIIPGDAPNFPDLSEHAAVTIAEIHFKPGAQLGGQSNLTAKAFVSYDLSTGKRERWNMLAIPLGQVVPGDFAFGGYPSTWVRTFTTYLDGAITKGGWVTAAGGSVAFSTGDGFVIWLNADGGANDAADKGLKQLEGILELPYFQHLDENSEEYDLYHSVNHAQEYSNGTGSVVGTSTFYNFQLSGSQYVRVESQNYDIERYSTAYQIAKGNVSKTLEFADGSFALMGNPFMAAFDFDEFCTDPANAGTIKDVYHIWINDGYESYSSTYGPMGRIGEVPLSKDIAPLQGFIVEKNDETPSPSPQFRSAIAPPELTFKDSWAKVNADVLLRSSSATAINRLDIIARNPAAGVRTLVAKAEGGQDEFGNLDARKIINEINNTPEIYTLKPYRGGSVAVSINVINNDDLLIPLGLATSYTGDITLTFSGMDNYYAGLSLIDVETNQTINLTGLASYEYTFNYTPKTINGEAAVCEDRFFIRISKSVTGLQETIAGKVNVFESNGLIRIVSGASNPIKEVSVYDLQGVLIYKKAAFNAVSHIVDRNFPAGAYIVKVVSEKNTDNVKVIKR